MTEPLFPAIDLTFEFWDNPQEMPNACVYDRFFSGSEKLFREKFLRHELVDVYGNKYVICGKKKSLRKNKIFFWVKYEEFIFQQAGSISLEDIKTFLLKNLRSYFGTEDDSLKSSIIDAKSFSALFSAIFGQSPASPSE